jgi:hypothetical protein
MRTIVALLVTAAASTSAHAQRYATEIEPSTSSENHVDGRIGFLFGGADVGDADGMSYGVSAGLGYRMGDLTLRGLVDYYRVGDNPDEMIVRRGRATRLGGALRYSFANNGDERGTGVDFWGETGLGLEHVAWRDGGILDRPSGELAIGLDIAGRGDLDRHGRRKQVGLFIDFRSFIGEAPEMPGAPSVCAGPCSKPTTPSRTDLSLFFELGVLWGR